MRRIQWLFLLLFVLCLSYLVFGEKPWGEVADKIAEAEAAGERPSWEDDVVLGLYGGAGINAILSLILAVTAGLWARPVALKPMEATSGGEGLAPRVFWILVAVAVLLSGALRWNFAHRSLWWDELWNARHAVVGNWKESKQPGAPMKFSRTTYARAAWYYQKPTNHIPAALASKVSYELWAKGSGASPGTIAEFPYRFPNFLISLASVFSIAVLVRRWGFGGGGIIAAFLMALHPWAIRYGIDMRAYSGLILLSILGCLWITRIIQTQGKAWRYWLLFGLNQFLLVWALPNAVWYAMGFFIALAALILLRGGGRNAIFRLLAVNVFAAMALFAVAAPVILQAYRWIQDLYQPHLITGELLRTTASELFYGMPWHWPAVREAEGIPDLLARSGGGTGLGILLVWGIPLALIATGFIRVALRERSAVAGLAALVGASLFYLWFTYSREELFYPRYLIYLLAPFVALLAIGMDGAARLLFRTKPMAALGLALFAGAGGYAFFVAPGIKLLATRSYEPFREVSDWLRENTPADSRVFGHGLGGRVIEGYYPDIRWDAQNTLENLKNEIADATDANAPFYAVFGYTVFNRTTFPDSSALLDDSARFEEVAAFPGIEPEFFFRILRLRKAEDTSPPPENP